MIEPLVFDEVETPEGGELWDALGMRVERVAAEVVLVEALIFDEDKHPRWPKGSPGGKGGQFMHVGEFFKIGGKEWEITQIVGGKVWAHRAGGKYSEVELKAFDVKQAGGTPTVPGVEEAQPFLVGGKSVDATVTIVDPYVDAASHSKSLKVPQGSVISSEEWERFGQLDQENYIALMGRYGAYEPGKAKSLLDKSYKDYETAVQEAVKTAYKNQYGSSSGWTLSLTSKLKGLLGGSSEAEKALKQRERAKQLQVEHAAIVQWDLYNRTRAPDVASFHKQGAGNAKWWQGKLIDGNQPAFSGLSQSYCYRRNFFGTDTLVTALAIRTISMSTISAQPVPGQSYFSHELEIASSEQLKLDSRSMALAVNELETPTQNLVKWLEGATTSPQGGWVVDELRAALKEGKKLPIPPQPAVITMDGQKGYPEPPAYVLEKVGPGKALNVDSLPVQQSVPLTPGDLSKEVPWANVGDDGLPEATVAKDSGFTSGDFMVGLKGTLYWIGPDTSDASGFGLRYHKVEFDSTGKPYFNGESYNFEGGGKNKYYRLAVNAPLAPQTESEGQVFDPGAYAIAAEEKFIGDMKPGEAFKVDGHAYEIIAQAGNSAHIKSLETGKTGKINADYKSQYLVPKDGYTPASGTVVEEPSWQPGALFVLDGEGYRVTSILKDGTLRVKPYSGGPVQKMSPEQVKDVLPFIPGDWSFGDKTKAKNLAVGDVIQLGKGQKVKPAAVIAKDSGSLTYVDLTTGKQHSLSAGKLVQRLVPSPVKGEQDTPAAAFDPAHWEEDPNALEVDDVSLLPPGTVFKRHTGIIYETQPVKEGAEKGAATLKVLYVPESQKEITTAGEVIELSSHQTKLAGGKILQKNEAGGMVAEFDLAAYSKQPEKGITEFAVGDKFVSPTGVPYEVAKKWSGQKHVQAKNLLTGKPYPVLASKTMTPLVAKADLPMHYDSLVSGDSVLLKHLKPGDQFTYPNAQGVFEVLEVSPSAEENAKIAHVGPLGYSGVPFTEGAYPDAPVTLWAKKADALQLENNPDNLGALLPVKAHPAHGLQPGDTVATEDGYGKVIDTYDAVVIVGLADGSYQKVPVLEVTPTTVLGVSVGNYLDTPAGKCQVLGIQAMDWPPKVIVDTDTGVQTFELANVTTGAKPSAQSTSVNKQDVPLKALSPGDKADLPGIGLVTITHQSVGNDGAVATTVRAESGKGSILNGDTVPNMIAVAPPSPKAQVKEPPSWLVPGASLVSKSAPDADVLEVMATSGNGALVKAKGVDGPQFYINAQNALPVDSTHGGPESQQPVYKTGQLIVPAELTSWNEKANAALHVAEDWHGTGSPVVSGETAAPANFTLLKADTEDMQLVPDIAPITVSDLKVGDGFAVSGTKWQIVQKDDYGVVAVDADGGVENFSSLYQPDEIPIKYATFSVDLDGGPMLEYAGLMEDLGPGESAQLPNGVVATMSPNPEQQWYVEVGGQKYSSVIDAASAATAKQAEPTAAGEPIDTSDIDVDGLDWAALAQSSPLAAKVAAMAKRDGELFIPNSKSVSDLPVGTVMRFGYPDAPVTLWAKKADALQGKGADYIKVSDSQILEVASQGALLDIAGLTVNVPSGIGSPKVPEPKEGQVVWAYAGLWRKMTVKKVYEDDTVMVETDEGKEWLLPVGHLAQFDAPAPPKPEVNVVQPDSIESELELNGFDYYKSAWASGGAYKYHPVDELVADSIIGTKGGRRWQVVSTGPPLVVIPVPKGTTTPLHKNDENYSTNWAITIPSTINGSPVRVRLFGS